MKLKSIALVRTGLVLSRKEAKQSDGTYEYRQLNLKSVDDTGTIIRDETVPFCTSEELPSNYLTQVGDIIVKTAEPYTAAYITDEYSGLVIPSHFVVVRVDCTKTIPQYITWYLNKDRIKKAFRMSCTGTLKQIKPTTIAEIEVNLPTLERQKQVVELYNISQQELKLLKKQIKHKEIFYKVMINKINRM